MATFVEQAELLVTDKSSTNIRKINSELTKLYNTAKKLQGLNKGGAVFGIKTANLSKATRDMRALDREAAKLASRRVSLNVNSNSLLSARTRLDTLRKDAGKGVNVRVKTNAELRNMVQRDGPRIGSGMADAFRNAMAIHALEIGRRIGRAAADALKEGTTLRDVAESKLTLQGLTPQQRGDVAQAAQGLAATNTFEGAGRIEDLLAELLGVTRGDLGQATSLAKETLRVAKIRISQGMDAETAIESAVTLSKAGEQSGAITNAQGNIDQERTRKFFDLMLKGQIMVGREMNDSLVKTLFKSLRTAKFSLNDRGILTALGLAEEMGSSAGVGINQMIKQLSGERVKKKQLAEMRALGLMDTKEVKSGTSGGKKTTETVSTGVIDAAKLRQNPLQWVIDNLIPRMTKKGLDVNNPVDVASFAGTITSDRTATDTLTGLILRAQELTKQIDRAQGLDVSNKTVNQLDQSSILLSVQSVSEQFVSLMGEVGHSFESILIPALQSTAGAFNSIASFIAGPTGEGSKARTAAVAGGAAATGVGAFFLGKKLLGLFNPLSASATALSGSAVALDGSAAALTEAAIALGATGGKPTFGRDGSLTGSKGGKFSTKGVQARGAAGLLIGGAVVASMPSTTEEMKAQWEGAAEASKTIESSFNNIVKTLGLTGAQEGIVNTRDAVKNAIFGPDRGEASTRDELTALLRRLEEDYASQYGRSKQRTGQKLTETEDKLMKLDIRDYASAANITDALTDGTTKMGTAIPELQDATNRFAIEAPAGIKTALSEGGQMVAASIREALAAGITVSTPQGPAPGSDTGSTAVTE